MRVHLAVAAVALALGGCEDIRQFQGAWEGSVSADPALRQGFAAGATMRATIAEASRTALGMTVQLPDRADAVPFEPVRHAADDALGEMRLDGDPLRTFVGYVRPAGADPLLAIVSLFAADHVDVRLVRGPDDVYGVFTLRHARAP